MMMSQAQCDARLDRIKSTHFMAPTMRGGSAYHSTPHETTLSNQPWLSMLTAMCMCQGRPQLLVEDDASGFCCLPGRLAARLLVRLRRGGMSPPRLERPCPFRPSPSSPAYAGPCLQQSQTPSGLQHWPASGETLWFLVSTANCTGTRCQRRKVAVSVISKVRSLQLTAKTQHMATITASRKRHGHAVIYDVTCQAFCYIKKIDGTSELVVFGSKIHYGCNEAWSIIAWHSLHLCAGSQAAPSQST